MSQSGKQFLSGLMNRVFRSNKESRSATQRRERSLSARRLGMEPLEDRQLLAVDPALLAANAIAEASSSPTVCAPEIQIDLTDATSVSGSALTGPTLAVSNASIEETTLVSTPESFQLSIDSPASGATLAADATQYPSVGLTVGTGNMGWAAALANMLTATGWGDANDVVTDSTQSVERQVFNYFQQNFTNSQTSLISAFAWYMNGKDEYYLANDVAFSQLRSGSEGGNLFPTSTGEFQPYSAYCQEIDASKFDSPLKYVKENLLSENYSVGIEVRYLDDTGAEVPFGLYTDSATAQSKQTWLTLWGLEYDRAYVDANGVDQTYAADDPRCFRAALVSDPIGGKVERYELVWNAVQNAYNFVDYGTKTVEYFSVDPATGAQTAKYATPYIHSFTAIQTAPGYADETKDAYEDNDSAEEIAANTNKTNPNLGVIDYVDGEGASDSGEKGNVVKLEDLRLDAKTDPVDYYRFELTLPAAANSDSIVLEYSEGQMNSALTSTLMLCGNDGSILPLNPSTMGFVDGRFDSKLESVVVYTTGEDGQGNAKTYRSVIYRETISLAGLPAGEYYLKVSFADSSDVAATNRGYSLTFRSGFDDDYEPNNSFEDVEPTAQEFAPVETKSNLGVLNDVVDGKATKTLEDLVLRQYDKNNLSEADWYRFETTGTGDLEAIISYRSTLNLENDGDLDLYVYKQDPSDPRGYSLLKKSGNFVTDREVATIENLEAGVYYVKVVGFMGAGNVHYKLTINAAATTDPDLSVAIPDGSSWQAPLIVSSERASSVEGAFATDETLGKNNPVYLNFNVATSNAADYDAAKLALYINGKRVDSQDVLNALNSSENKGLANLDLLKELFGQGYNWKTDGVKSIQVVDFSVGKISDPDSLASKYFNADGAAANTVALVVNPDNYALGAFYADDASSSYQFADGETVRNGAQTLTFTRNDYVFSDGRLQSATGGDVVLKTGAILTVSRQTSDASSSYRTLTPIRYDAEKMTFDFVEGDRVVCEYFADAQGSVVELGLGSVVSVGEVELTKLFGNALVSKTGVAVDRSFAVAADKEYNPSNNVATAFFYVDDFADDAFAPNGSPAIVDANTNPTNTNPDLGVVNLDGLTQSTADPTVFERNLEDLMITGSQNGDGSYLADWFKFSLVKGADSADSDANYGDFRIELNANNQNNDFDLYVYEVVLNDPTESFNEAYANGDYTIRLVAKSAGAGSAETVSYAQIKANKQSGSNQTSDSTFIETYFVRVVGFAGSKGSYGLNLTGFSDPAEVAIPVPNPSDYFTTENVSIVNSVATLDWSVNLKDVEAGKTNPRKWTNQYVAETTVQYRVYVDQMGDEEGWTTVPASALDGASCKISGLNSDCNYQFRLTATNAGAGVSSTASAITDLIKTDAFMNEVVYRAVIVGVADYPGASADVSAAANDAEAFRAELLKDPQWVAENVYTFIDSNATADAVRSAMAKIAKESDDNDVFVFYFAGSGMYRISGGQRVGYLKTYGTSTTQYVSNLNLTEWTSEIAAGSKQFILDAGQIPYDVNRASGADAATADYGAFIDSLVGASKNGDSVRPALVSVLTSGQTGEASNLSAESRTDFSRALIEGMQKYSEAVDQAAVDAALVTDPSSTLNVSDGRVAISELFTSICESSAYVKSGYKPLYVISEASSEAILTNGVWEETAQFDDSWFEENAVVVTTAVDSVDKYDGKISLREAIQIAKDSAVNPIARAVELQNGATFTLLQGFNLTIGTRSGELLADVKITYSNGTFKTLETCSFTSNGKTYEFKAGTAIVLETSITPDKMVDEKGVVVSSLIYNKYATYSESEISDSEEYKKYVKLDESSVLKTSAASNAKDITVKLVDGRYQLYSEGVLYTKTFAYLDGKRVEFEERAETTQEYVFKRIVFDDSVKNQPLTVDRSQASLDIDYGVVIDATSTKGGVAFDLTFGQTTTGGRINVTSSDLVSLVGVKIYGAVGQAAISVAQGARFELANSVVYDCENANGSALSNAGTTSLVNVTFANNRLKDSVVFNDSTGTIDVDNSLFALNSTPDGAQIAPVVEGNGTAFVLNETNLNSALADPGFVDAAKNDFRLNGSTSPACDIGDSSKTRLLCGLVLDYDLQGDVRVSYGAVDAGAYEYVVDPAKLEKPSTVVTILDDVVDLEDGEISLREAVFYAGSQYDSETELAEGTIVTAQNGFQYVVKNGKFIAYLGASGTENGIFYKTSGLYLVDATGVQTVLPEGAIVNVASGDEATVVEGVLRRADGSTVAEGETIRYAVSATAAPTTGTLAFSASYKFGVGQSYYATLTFADLDSVLPATVTTFDSKEYKITFNANGTFSADVDVTTTENNTSTTTAVSITFQLREGAVVADKAAGSEDVTSSVVTTSRAVKLVDGDYSLVADLYETIGGQLQLLFKAGTVFSLVEGTFYDAKGSVVRIPVGTELLAPSGTKVLFASSNSSEYVPAVGEELTLTDGTVRKFKEGATVYETVRLGTNITFAPELNTGAKSTITLDRGAISVDRPMTLDATAIGGLTLDAQNASRVFTINSYREDAATEYVVLTGLTLQNGSAKDGGLISVAKDSNVRVVDSTLQNAEASNEGGAIYNAGKLTLSASTSVVATSALLGGAVYNVGTLTVEGSISNASAQSGGAIYNVGTVSFVGGTVSDSKATVDGGLVYNAGTTSLTKKTTLTGGSAQNGGAIYSTGSVSVNNASIRGNSAQNGAALYVANAAAGRVSLTSATLADNKATGAGGAIYAATPIFATRSVFANNEASDGAAIAAQDGANVTIVNSLILVNKGSYALTSAGSASFFFANDTIYGNQAGAIRANGESLTVFNSIVGGNSGVDIDGSAQTFDVRYNMVEISARDLDSTNLLVFNPQFRSVEGTDWTAWNLRLSAGSAAIDTGSTDVAYYFNFNGVKVAITNDFADAVRPNGPQPDMGAYEIDNSQETPSTVVTTLEDVYDPYDGLISLREAVAYAAVGNSETNRTVTFSDELFEFDPEGFYSIYVNAGDAIYQDPYGGSATKAMGTIVLQGNVVVTTAYTNSLGETAYRDLAIDGRGATSLFLKIGSGDAELRGLTLRNGLASGENPDGGAILLREGSLSVVDCYVVDNRSEGNGGAIAQENGSLFVVDSLFANNVAERDGGAIYVEGGRSYIYNATIAENDARRYGGVFANGSNILTIANSVVAQNGGAQNCDLYVANGNLNAVANLIGAMDKWSNQNGFNGNYVGLPESPIDPLFVGDPNGDFATFVGKAKYGKYELTSNSLAVNSGVNAYANGPDGVRLKLDLSAKDRIAGEVVDMGAFESAFRDVPSTVVTTALDVVDQTDGVISLREALKYSTLLGTTITFDLGEGAEGVSIQLDPELGSLDITSSVAIDASLVPGGVAIVGADASVFRVLKSGTSFADGTRSTENGALILTNLILTGGNANRGGGVYLDGGALSMTNCLVYGNEAAIGGGLYVATAVGETGANVKLLNTTIAGNDAGDFPGVYFGSARGSFELQNTIVAGNASETSTAVENYDLYVAGSFSATASVVGIATEDFAKIWNGVNGVSVGTLDAVVDPGFAGAASNDFSLASDSIAVNQGSNRMIGQAGYYSSILFAGSNVRVLRSDVVGNVRLVGGTVDIGAYEYQIASEAPSVVVTTLEDVVNPFDGKISLREAIEYAGSAYFEDGLVVKVGRTITFDSALAGGSVLLNETLNFTKCATIDATGLKGGLTVASTGEFGVFNIDAIADAVADEVVLAGLKITGGKATSGAGVYHVGGKLTLLNCAVYDNEASYGAGVRSDAGTLSLVNVTITKNSATYAYGGVYSIGGTVVLHNSLIAKNEVNGESGVDVYISSVGEMRSTMIGAAFDRVANEFDGKRGNVVGTPANVVDPAFVDWDKNDFSLGRDADGFNSRAINAGDNVLAVFPNGSVPSSDANGELRFVGGTVDMGAFESELGPSEMPSLIVTTALDVVDAYDGLISLREAVAYVDNYNLEKTITFAPSINGSTLYLKKALTINVGLTIDGLANGAQGFTLTTSDDVNTERVIYVNNGDVVMNGLTITNRRYERLQAGLDDLDIAEGGAIYVRAGSISLYNSLICNNGADKGSAVYVNQENATATAKLVNCTVVDNTSLDENEDGSTIYVGKGTITLQNTIVAFNDSVALDASQTAQDVYVSGATVSVWNSYVSYSDTLALAAQGNGSYIGNGALDLSAETDRLFVDVDNRDYRLNGDSLATNAGNNTFVNQGTINGTFDSYDIDGLRRIYYATIDMGAFENQTAKDSPIESVAGTNVTLRVTTGNDVIDPNDGVTSLREALALTDRMYVLGYTDITIEMGYVGFGRFYSPNDTKLQTSCLQINSPVTINGYGSVIDCDYSNCAFQVNTSGKVEISDLVITNGYSVDGGAIKLLEGDLVLRNDLIYNCEAQIAGGAVYSSSDGKLELYNVTIAKNVAVKGDGIYATGSGFVGLYNSILATNRSATLGETAMDFELQGVVSSQRAGVDSGDKFTGDFEIANTIIGNVGTTANFAVADGKATDSQVGYGDDAAVDPKFLDASSGNFRLSPTESSARNAGAMKYASGYDLNGAGLATLARVSMGAYQVGRETPSTVVTTELDIVDDSDGLISLREAINYSQNELRVDVIYGGHQAGTGHMNDSAYNAVNAMNNASVYSGTYINPITFDKSLAGKTIVLKSAADGADYGTFVFDQYNTWSNSLQDYMIDASALSGLGGITIDASAINGTLFDVVGGAVEDAGVYYPIHLDLRNLKIVGSGMGTCVATNQYAMVSFRNCLVSDFRLAIDIGDDDSNDGSIAHVYSSTFTSTNIRVMGELYMYNSILSGTATIVYTDPHPGYRQAYLYYSIVNVNDQIGGRWTEEGCTWNASDNFAGGLSFDDVFLNPQAGDYRLATYSPAINVGNNVYRRTLEPIFADGEVDLNGNPRVLNTTVDMGCYESSSVKDIPSAVVTTLDDVVDPNDGLISLREAAIYAQQWSRRVGNVVTFSSTLNGGTIALKDGPIQITRDVKIRGINETGAVNNVTISGNSSSSIFDINATDTIQTNLPDVQLSDLILTAGSTATNGGAICITNGNVQMDRLTIYGCYAAQYGGAIYAYDSELYLTDCKIGGNNASFYGGFVNQFGRTVLEGCYIAENTGVKQDADVWGYYPDNFSHSKNNVIGYVKDIYLYDGVDGNKIGTADNRIKPFVSVATGDLSIKPESEWRRAEAASGALADAFALFADDEEVDESLDVEWASFESTAFDDDLFELLNK